MLHAQFGYIGSGVIGDTVWSDLDGNGSQGFDNAGNLEPGVGGVILAVVWAGPDGIPGTPDDVEFGTQVTNSMGYYLFTGLPYGNYVVSVGGAPPPYAYVGPTSLLLTIDPSVAGVALSADFPLALPAAPTAAVEELPKTGFDTNRALQVAITLLALGAMIAAVTRRREEDGD